MSDSTEVLPDFNKGDGIVPVVVQDVGTGAVLTLAYMNAEAYAETMSTGRAVYYSRSRKSLWRKGETSGHTQRVCGVYFDCDRDAVLLKVEQQGGACHEGFFSCFFREATANGLVEIAERVFDPADVYRSK